MEKSIQFAVAVVSKIQEAIDEGEIDKQDLLDHTTEFIHAVANVAPTMIYSRLTGDEVNNLEFNHIANKLCFQYSTKE